MVTPCVTMVTSVPVVPALFRSSTCFLAVLQTFVPPGGGDGQGSVDLFVHPHPVLVFLLRVPHDSIMCVFFSEGGSSGCHEQVSDLPSSSHQLHEYLNFE